MNALIATPDRDRDPEKPGDFSGAFKPESVNLARCLRAAGHLTQILRVDMGASPHAQRTRLLSEIAATRPIGLLAVACHGWRSGIQIGWSLDNVSALAAALADAMVPPGAAEPPDLVVMLYACSTERDAPGVHPENTSDGRSHLPGTSGDGGFADALRDALALLRPDWTGCVLGHTVAGHCTRNPYVRLMAGPSHPSVVSPTAEPKPAGADLVGGDWLVDPTSPHWATWRAALRSKDGKPYPGASTLRYRFPLMTRKAVLAELSQVRAAFGDPSDTDDITAAHADIIAAPTEPTSNGVR